MNMVNFSSFILIDQSLYYNEKHRDITTHNINGFVASYNCGICQRVLGKIEESLKSFEQALQMAEEENVSDILSNTDLRILNRILFVCVSWLYLISSLEIWRLTLNTLK